MPSVTDPALAPELTLVPNGCTYAYGFTAIKAPVDSARVRRALSLALDRPSLAGTHYLPATTFMPAGLLPPEDRIAGIARDERAAQETMAAIADKLDVRSDADDAMAEVQQDVDPVAVMDAIEATKADANGS